MNEILYGSGIHHILEGYYKVAVVDAKTNKVVWEQPNFVKNLILNQGLDVLPNVTYASIFAFAIAGGGTRVNSLPGSTATVTQTGSLVTLTPGGGFNSFTASAGGYSSQLQVGDVIAFNTGSGGVNFVQIAGNITDVSASANVSASIPSTTFTIWKTSQTSLQTEVKRGGNGITDSYYLTGPGNCYSNFTGSTMTMQRTYDLAAETGSFTYNEIGVGWGSTYQSSTTFSRILLAAPVVVASGQRLRIVYQLQIAFSPNTPNPRPNVTITGWPVSPATNTNGSESIQVVLSSGPDINGNYSNDTVTYVPYSGLSAGNSTIEPSSIGGNCAFWLSNVSTSLSSFNNAVDRTTTSAIAGVTTGGQTTYQSAYVSGSYTLNKTAKFSLQDMNRTDLGSMGFGTYTPYTPTSTANQAFCFVFNQNQTKTNTQTLTLSYTWTWGRTLA